MNVADGLEDRLPVKKHEIKDYIEMKRLIASLAITGFVMPMRAAEPDSVRLREVTVVSARHRADNVYRTMPTQSLGQQDIHIMGLQGMADAVRRFAGASVKDYGGIGGMKTVSVRNLGAHHTAVSYDGITVSNTQAGQVDIGRFSLDNVAMVSMAIGQGTDLMQSARHYASAGVLAVETLQPELKEKPWMISGRLTGGSWGQFNPRLRYWQRLGRATVASVDADWMRADGMYAYTLVNGREKSREKRHNTDISQWHVEGNVNHTFRDSSSLKAKVYYYRSERGLPGSVVLYNPKSNERLWDENFFAQAQYSIRWSPEWQMAARGKFTRSWNKYQDHDVKYTDGVLTEQNTQREYYASATIGYKPTEWLDIALAEDVAVNTLSTTVNGSPNPVRFTSLTAFTMRASAGRLRAEAGAVMTFATESLTESEKYSIYTPDDRHKLSPSVSFSYRLLNSEALYLRAMMKSTFRMPTFNDLYYLRIGNTSLRPEKAMEWGGGITWRSRQIGPLRFVALTADGYYNDVEDKIVAFPSTYIWKMANFGKVHIYGMDITAAAEVDIARRCSVILNGSFTWQDAKDRTPGSMSYGSQLPYTPKTIGSASAMLLTPWVNVGYSMTGQGTRYSTAQNTRQYLIAAYSEHSVSLSRDFRLRSGLCMSLQLTINNITDRQYEIIKYYPMPGRSFMASVAVKY